jgi:hypothetical protein
MYKNIPNRVPSKILNGFIPTSSAKITFVVENKQGSRFLNGIEIKHIPSAQELINQLNSMEVK